MEILKTIAFGLGAVAGLILTLIVFYYLRWILIIIGVVIAVSNLLIEIGTLVQGNIPTDWNIWGMVIGLVSIMIGVLCEEIVNGD